MNSIIESDEFSRFFMLLIFFSGQELYVLPFETFALPLVSTYPLIADIASH